MTVLDRLRNEGAATPIASVRGLLAISSILTFCSGIAITLHDALDPAPLLGWRVGLAVTAAGAGLLVLSSWLDRRHFDRTAARLGVSRRQADAIWAEDDDA